MQSLEEFWPDYPFIKPQFLIEPHLKLEELEDFILSHSELPRLENGTLLICNVGLYDIIELVDFANCASVRNHKPLKIMTLTEDRVEDLINTVLIRFKKVYNKLEDILGRGSVICFSAIIPPYPITHFFAQAKTHFPKEHTSMSGLLRDNLDRIRSKIQVICTRVNKHLEACSRMPSLYKIMSSYHLNYKNVGQAFEDGLNLSLETSRLLASRLNRFLLELFYGVEINTNFVNYKRDKQVVVIGDSRMMLLQEMWHGDRPQFYCEPNLGFYNFSKFINRKLLDLEDKIVIVCLGLNDLIHFVNSKSCLGKHHKPNQIALSLCERYNSTEEYFKKIREDFKSSFTLFCTRYPALIFFATVYPIHIDNYMNSQVKIHKEKTGHDITPTQMNPEVNTKLSELVHWLNSLIKDVCCEHSLPYWDMFHVVCRGSVASASRPYVLKDGIYPCERVAEELNRSFFSFARGKLIQKFCENVKEYKFQYRPLPTCNDYPTNKIWLKNVDTKLSTEKTQRGVDQSTVKKKTEVSKPIDEKIKIGHVYENKETPKIESLSQSSGALNYEKSKTLEEEKKGPTKEETNSDKSKHPEKQTHVDDKQKQILETSFPKGSYQKSQTLNVEKGVPAKEVTNSNLCKLPTTQKYVDDRQKQGPETSCPQGRSTDFVGKGALNCCLHHCDKSETLEEEMNGPAEEETKSDISKHPESQKQKQSPETSYPQRSYKKMKIMEEKEGPVKEERNTDISKYPESQKYVEVRQSRIPGISFPKGSQTLNKEKGVPTKEVSNSNLCKHTATQKYVDNRQKQGPAASGPQGRSGDFVGKSALNCCLYHSDKSKTLKEEKKGPTKEETKSDTICKHLESQKQKQSPETSYTEINYQKSQILNEEKGVLTKEVTNSNISKYPESQNYVDDRQKQGPETSCPQGRSADFVEKGALNCCLYHCDKSKTLKEEKKGLTNDDTQFDICKHPESQMQKQSPETSYPERSYKKIKIMKEEKEGPIKKERSFDVSRYPVSRKPVDDRQRHSSQPSYPQGRSHQPDTHTGVPNVEARTHSSNLAHRLSLKDNRLSPFTRSEDRRTEFHMSEKYPGSEERKYPLPSPERHPCLEERRHPLPSPEGRQNSIERCPLPSSEAPSHPDERRYPLPSSERHSHSDERYLLTSLERQPHTKERTYPLPSSERSRSSFHGGSSWFPMYTGRSMSPKHYPERGRKDRESDYNLEEAPWSKIASALEAFTESNRRIRKQCQKEKDPISQDALVDLFSTHARECESFLDKPDAHPDYFKEYRLFLDKKRDFIIKLGGDPETYDYIKEWGKIWPSCLYDLFQRSWEVKKKECLSMISSKRKRSSSSSSSSRSPTPERVTKRLKNMASKPKKCLSKLEKEKVLEDSKDMMLPRQEMKKLREPNDQSQSVPYDEKVSSSKKVVKKKVVKIVEVLGILVYMKDKLGVFGVPVKVLYEKAVEMEKRGLNPNTLLEDEETAVLCTTLSDKLNSLIKGGDGSAIQNAIFQEACTLLVGLITEINKNKRKDDTKLHVNVAKIAGLTMGKTISDTISTINYFLKCEGYSDVSKEDLENLYVCVKDEQLRLTESASCSQSNRFLSSPSGFDRAEQKTVGSETPGQGTKSSPSRDVGFSKPTTVKASTSKFDTPVELDEEFFTGKKFLRPSDSVDSSRTEEFFTGKKFLRPSDSVDSNRTEEFFTGKKFLRPSDSVDNSRTEVTLKSTYVPHKHALPEF